jgi:hypothetical protein
LNIKYEYTPCVGHHPGFPLLVEAQYELLKTGDANFDSSIIDNSCSAIYAKTSLEQYKGVI